MTRSAILRQMTVASLLFVLLAAWPLSYVPGLELSVGIENTPAFRWRFFTGGVTSFPGYSIWIGDGHCCAFEFRDAPNPRPPATGPYMTVYGGDKSRWHGNMLMGAGTLLTGNLFHADWQARSGTVFPFWPLSLAAGFLLYRHVRRMIRSFKLARNASLCLTCSYDLRAHKPGDKCPECGTPVEKRP